MLTKSAMILLIFPPSILFSEKIEIVRQRSRALSRRFVRYAAELGYEGWQAISISRNERVVAMILGNPVMIDAYPAGIPGNGKPVPDGARMAKIHWTPKQNQFFPEATVPGNLLNVDFMVKDGKRFADSGGWGYAVFDYDAASDTSKPGTSVGTPPQGNDAKCGFACHTIVKTKDYVFTEYGKR